MQRNLESHLHPAKNIAKKKFVKFKFGTVGTIKKP
jgi:hypothetical protein